MPTSRATSACRWSRAATSRCAATRLYLKTLQGLRAGARAAAPPRRRLLRPARAARRFARWACPACCRRCAPGSVLVANALGSGLPRIAARCSASCRPSRSALLGEELRCRRWPPGGAASARRWQAVLRRARAPACIKRHLRRRRAMLGATCAARAGAGPAASMRDPDAYTLQALPAAVAIRRCGHGRRRSLPRAGGAARVRRGRRQRRWRVLPGGTDARGRRRAGDRSRCSAAAAARTPGCSPTAPVDTFSPAAAAASPSDDLVARRNAGDQPRGREPVLARPLHRAHRDLGGCARATLALIDADDERRRRCWRRCRRWRTAAASCRRARPALAARRSVFERA